MTGCRSRMTLPPQSEHRTIRCDLEEGHWPGSLHCAPDEDGVVRRWPSDDSQAARACGVLETGSPSDVLPRLP